MEVETHAFHYFKILCQSNIELEEIGRSTVSVDQNKSNKRVQDKRDACPASATPKPA